MGTLNLNKRTVFDPRYRERANDVLTGFEQCEIVLLDMHLGDSPTAYDWRTNAGGQTAPTILYSGPAQLQVYRFTLTMDAPVGSVDQVRTMRFLVDHAEIADVDIRVGQQIRVTSCPSDSTLERYQYTVNSGLNSGSSFRRTIEAEVDMNRVVPPLVI